MVVMADPLGEVDEPKPSSLSDVIDTSPSPVVGGRVTELMTGQGSTLLYCNHSKPSCLSSIDITVEMSVRLKL